MTNQLNQIMQMFGGQQAFQQRFNAMQQQFAQQGINPQQQVQELLNSGRMSQQGFNLFSGLANVIMKNIPLFK